MVQEFSEWFLPGIKVATPAAEITSGSGDKAGVFIERTNGSKFTVDASSCKSAHHIMHKLMEEGGSKKSSDPSWMK